MIQEIALGSTGRGYQKIASAINGGQAVKVILPKGKKAVEKAVKFLNKLAKEFEVEHRFELNENWRLQVVVERASIGAGIGGAVGVAAWALGFVTPVAIPIAACAGGLIGGATETVNFEIKITHRKTGHIVVHFKTQ